MSSDQFWAALAPVLRNNQLLVLSCCYGAALVEDLLARSDALPTNVVASKHAPPDAVAVAFSGSLYEELLRGKTITAAMTAANDAARAIWSELAAKAHLEPVPKEPKQPFDYFSRGATSMEAAAPEWSLAGT